MNRSYQRTKTTTLSVASGIAPKIISLKRSSMSSCNLRLKQSLQEQVLKTRDMTWYDLIWFNGAFDIKYESQWSQKWTWFQIGEDLIDSQDARVNFDSLSRVCSQGCSSNQKNGSVPDLYGCFRKWWYPTTIGFPTKNDHFGVWNGSTPIFGNTQKNTPGWSKLWRKQLPLLAFILPETQKSGPNNPHFSLTVLETETEKSKQCYWGN